MSLLASWGTDMEQIEPISQEVSAALFADLKAATKPGGWMEDDSFRYTMFARRLIAAEYGRKDAVEWANDWYAKLCQEQQEIEQARQAAIESRIATETYHRERRCAGISDNPRFQAFLDTVESPDVLVNNAEYMIFLNTRVAEFKRIHGPQPYVHSNQWHEDLTAYIRDYADQHLSNRVRAKRGLSSLLH